jgi:hypothetical protein
MTSLRDDADPSYEVVDVAGGPARSAARYVLTHRADAGIVGLNAADEPLGPAVLVPADWTYAQLVGSDAVTLLDLTSTGVLLVDGEQPVGVLPLDAVRRYLSQNQLLVDTRTLGDDGAADGGLAAAGLAGDYQLGRARVVCAEPGCGYVNALNFFDRYRPPDCANPNLPAHELKLPT